MHVLPLVKVYNTFSNTFIGLRRYLSYYNLFIFLHVMRLRDDRGCLYLHFSGVKIIGLSFRVRRWVYITLFVLLLLLYFSIIFQVVIFIIVSGLTIFVLLFFHFTNVQWQLFPLIPNSFNIQFLCLLGLSLLDTVS